MTTTTNNSPAQQNLRKVAVLVAAMDDLLAEQLLSELPEQEAAAVRPLVQQLEKIDQAELQMALNDFRKESSAPRNSEPTATPSQLDGIELDPSLLARLSTDTHPDVYAEPASPASPWKTLGSADATTLVKMLSAEQPQTIAVVLSRLETSQAAELVGQLPPTLQTEVLERVADLDPADEQILEVVASQLSDWINTQQQRKQRLAAGRDLVQRILQSTPSTQRAVMLTRLEKRNPNLAQKLSGSTIQTRVETTPNNPAPFDPQPVRNRPDSEVIGGPLRQPSAASGDPLEDLESLDDLALLRAMQQANRQTVMLALAGAGESLLKRILKGLPRRQAKQFRQQIRSLGPVRLADMLAAQQELVRYGQPKSTS